MTPDEIKYLQSKFGKKGADLIVDAHYAVMDSVKGFETNESIALIITQAFSCLHHMFDKKYEWKSEVRPFVKIIEKEFEKHINATHEILDD